MTCECISWAALGPNNFGEYHHKDCPHYQTEKFSRLFYYEEAENCWVPMPNKPDELFDVSAIEDGE